MKKFKQRLKRVYWNVTHIDWLWDTAFDTEDQVWELEKEVCDLQTRICDLESKIFELNMRIDD